MMRATDPEDFLEYTRALVTKSVSTKKEEELQWFRRVTISAGNPERVVRGQSGPSTVRPRSMRIMAMIIARSRQYKKAKQTYIGAIDERIKLKTITDETILQDVNKGLLPGR
ncbi:uncharacterized protein LOC106670362 [Cimex lectularius]|uniref:Uncharacterized protein n=1 Tax=Cimex lectularius TaxID=79782 RepID=A0A8I6ST12_CIMLE|nr:uncharacterized protein LOC106670362 [Cimex lectularius]